MPRLFILDDARPQHPAVRRWLAKHPGPLGEIAGHWFEALRAAGNDVCEVLHDGQPTVCVDGAAFAYVAIHQAHVNVGFFDGAALPDPHRLLRGSGKFMRHVRVSPHDTVDQLALTALVHAAYAALKAALAEHAPPRPPIHAETCDPG